MLPVRRRCVRFGLRQGRGGRRRRRPGRPRRLRLLLGSLAAGRAHHLAVQLRSQPSPMVAQQHSCARTLDSGSAGGAAGSNHDPPPGRRPTAAAHPAVDLPSLAAGGRPRHSQPVGPPPQRTATAAPGIVCRLEHPREADLGALARRDINVVLSVGGNLQTRGPVTNCGAQGACAPCIDHRTELKRHCPGPNSLPARVRRGSDKLPNGCPPLPKFTKGRCAKATEPSRWSASRRAACPACCRASCRAMQGGATKSPGAHAGPPASASARSPTASRALCSASLHRSRSSPAAHASSCTQDGALPPVAALLPGPLPRSILIWAGGEARCEAEAGRGLRSSGLPLPVAVFCCFVNALALSGFFRFLEPPLRASPAAMVRIAY
jgi:hypothetical protein